MATKATFNWADPLLLDQQLTDDERAVRDAARAYCQDRLQPRVLEAFRQDHLVHRMSFSSSRAMISCWTSLAPS